LSGTAIVIDDTPEAGQQLAGILTRLGLSVVGVYENGIAGLQAIVIAKPTIATVDIQMPGIAGLDLVAQARRRGVTSKLVICSGTKQHQVKAQALAAGADAFIVKPYDQVLVGRDLKALIGSGR